MKLKPIALAAALIATLAGFQAAVGQEASTWRIEGSRATPPFRMTLPDAGGVSWIFDCSGSELKITETGVTDLLDMEAGGDKRVPDTGPDRVMPEGSALMGLVTNPEHVAFVPGAAVPNPVKGWDLTIQLPRNDKSFQKLANADLIVMFTTGFTPAVTLSKEDKKLVSGFVKECRKG